MQLPPLTPHQPLHPIYEGLNPEVSCQPDKCFVGLLKFQFDLGKVKDILGLIM